MKFISQIRTLGLETGRPIAVLRRVIDAKSEQEALDESVTFSKTIKLGLKDEGDVPEFLAVDVSVHKI